MALRPRSERTAKFRRGGLFPAQAEAAIGRNCLGGAQRGQDSARVAANFAGDLNLHQDKSQRLLIDALGGCWKLSRVLERMAVNDHVATTRQRIIPEPLASCAAPTNQPRGAYRIPYGS